MSADPAFFEALRALPPLRDTIARHDLAPRKSLGQNFILDMNLLNRIVRVPGCLQDACVYEVGPGPGGLTRALLAAGARVVAVERDPRAVQALGDLCHLAGDRLRIVEADALCVDDERLAGHGAHIVANLPYNIGTALLVSWLETPCWPPWWRSLTLMFQKEVAERITAQVGDPAYGRLSVLAGWRSKARIALNVPAQAFHPKPCVDSAVVHLVPHQMPDEALPLDPVALGRTTRIAFSQRRKMLRAIFKSVAGGLEALEACGISGEQRAQTVQRHEFVALARVLRAAGAV